MANRNVSALRPRVEYCSCDWMNKDVEALRNCGCGRGHQARLYRDTVVHWKGGHWRIECAFEDAVAMLLAS